MCSDLNKFEDLLRCICQSVEYEDLVALSGVISMFAGSGKEVSAGSSVLSNCSVTLFGVFRWRRRPKFCAWTSMRYSSVAASLKVVTTKGKGFFFVCIDACLFASWWLCVSLGVRDERE